MGDTDAVDIERSAIGPAQLTDYHAKYFAHELTKRCPSDSVEKLARRCVDAQVDLNPHQVDAALFAFRSPLSKGAARRRGRPRQDHRGGAGALAEVGGAQAAHPRHHAVEPAQAVASGADREVLPALPHPRSEVLQRGDQGKASFRPFEADGRSSSAPTSSPGTRRPTSQHVPWDLWSSTKRTGCATSTSPRTSSPTR